MRRVLLVITKILLFVAGFACALWLFMPWREVGSAAMTFAAGQLERSGMQLNFSDVMAASDGSGFVVNNFSLASFVSVAFNSITIKPQLIASVLNLAPTCNIAFRNAAITMGQSMNFGDGGFLLTVQILGAREILLEKLHSNGDFAVNGFLSFDPAQRKVSRSDAALRVPDSFEQNMSTLQAFLPLEKQGDNWFLRRK